MEGHWSDWMNCCVECGFAPWCLVIGVILGLWLLRASCRCRRTVSIGTDELGKITISMRALRESIRGCCLRAEERVCPCVAVCRKKDHLRVRICLRAPVGCNVQSVAHRIQTLTITQLRDQFGFGANCSVDVRITGFLPADRLVDLKTLDRPASSCCHRKEEEDQPR